MYEVLTIVKNAIGDIVGYDLKDIDTGTNHSCVPVSDLSKIDFSNAMYINGKRPYIKGKYKIPIRVENSKITLFHGSSQEVKKPMYGKGKLANDYGQGFYTTTEKERAEEWALLMSGDSICNEYQIDTNGLKICNLDDFGPLAWIAEVLRNRGLGNHGDNEVARLFCDKYCINTSIFDIICGYRADDSYFSIIESFMNDRVAANEVVGFFHEAKLGNQVFIKSRKAFSTLRFIRAKRVSNSRLQYARNNDGNARSRVQSMLNNRRLDIINRRVDLKNELTITNCLRHDFKYDSIRGLYYE